MALRADLGGALCASEGRHPRRPQASSPANGTMTRRSPSPTKPVILLDRGRKSAEEKKKTYVIREMFDEAGKFNFRIDEKLGLRTYVRDPECFSNALQTFSGTEILWRLTQPRSSRSERLLRTQDFWKLPPQATNGSGF